MGLMDKIYKNASFELETNADGDIDTVRGECLYRLVTGGFEMFYKEQNAETRIRLTAGSVELERKGDQSYKITLLPQEKTTTVMNTPYGKVELSVEGEEMLYMPMVHGFDAVFRYNMIVPPAEEKLHFTIALRVKFKDQN